MKIGIVTQPLISNYGGFLQAWALQEQLRKMGHEPITVDYLPGTTPWWFLMCSWLKTLLWLCIGRKRPFAKKYPAAERIDMFDKFVQRKMSMTHCVHCYNSKLVEQYGLDAVIVGSDQVWRPRYNLYLKDMFLRFVHKVGVKKIAYAASFGVDKWEYTQRQTKVCAHLVKKFDAVSVRENSGISLCRNYLGVDAIEVLDPTLLHTAEDYEKLCVDLPRSTEQYLACYVLDLTREKRVFIEKVAKKQGLSVRIFSADKNAKLSVEEWIAIYRDASFVVTDSFHGTVFSILFRKPFLSIVNAKRGNIRFSDFLTKIGLEHLLYNDILADEYYDANINWEEVDNKIKALKKSAHFFINTALK